MRKETEQLLKATENLNIGRYCIGGLTLIELVDIYKNKPFDGMWEMFKIGFVKGQRFEKSKSKKLKNRKGPTHA